MSTIPEYKDLLKKQELVDARYTKKICLFLGAGVARNLGMPDWIDLSKNIVDFCATHKLFKHSEKESFYWKQFTNENIKIYEYSIEDGGYNNFAQVINDLKNFICEYEEPPIVAYTHPEDVEGL